VAGKINVANKEKFSRLPKHFLNALLFGPFHQKFTPQTPLRVGQK